MSNNYTEDHKQFVSKTRGENDGLIKKIDREINVKKDEIAGLEAQKATLEKDNAKVADVPEPKEVREIGIDPVKVEK